MTTTKDSYTTEWAPLSHNQPSDDARRVVNMLADFMDDGYTGAELQPLDFREWRCARLCVYEFRTESGHVWLVEIDEDPPAKAVRVEVRR
jgi:hypothetical protein